MKYITYEKALRLIDRTIDGLESKLNGHAEKVAYVMFKLLQGNTHIDKSELLKICMTAYFHDIGCYKSNDVTSLSEFEIDNPHPHALYGYIFLKNFFKDEIYLNVIKYHHVKWCDYNKFSSIPELANLLLLADRVSIQSRNQNKCLNQIKKNSNIIFKKAFVDLFIESDKKFNILNKLNSGLYRIEIRSFLSKFFLDNTQINHFAKLMCYAIDFHSKITVYHSMLVSSISESLASLLKLSNEDIRIITISASMHDIGKLLIPIDILEKPGKLTAEEYDIIKYHAIAGYDILSELGYDTIRDIGTLHHEKLDGSGYPFGLTGNDIPFYTRIVAVADILAALLEKRSYKNPMSKVEIYKILENMSLTNKTDSSITQILLLNYDNIVAKAMNEAMIYKELASNMEKEYINEYSAMCSCLDDKNINIS